MNQKPSNIIGRRRYLGDNIYVDYTGYELKLSITRYNITCEISLDRNNITELIDFLNQIANETPS